MLDGASLLVAAPTSAGKTFVGEMAAARAVTDGRKAAFLLPYRALVNKKYEQFSALYGERLGMRVVRCTGDYSDQTSLFVRGLALLNQLGLVVLDEAQFITDPNRGISVELLLTHLLAAREKVIVFRNQRGPAQGCANYLAQGLGLPPATDAVEALPTHDPTSTSAALRSCLAGGTAFHNTNLTREEKAVVERSFRDPDSPVRVLAATTTVAAGINTPASTVILAEQEFIGEDGRQFTVAEYKNMAGRAGRLGFNEEGKAIVLADNRYERDSLFERYVLGRLDSLQSSFDPRQLDTWIVRLLAQVVPGPA